MGFVRQPFVWFATKIYSQKRMPLQEEEVEIDEFYPIRSAWSDEFVYEQLTRELERAKVSSHHCEEGRWIDSSYACGPLSRRESREQ